MCYYEHKYLTLIVLFLQEDIFQQPGLRSEFADIRDCLDTGMPDSLRILSNHYYHYHHRLKMYCVSLCNILKGKEA